MPEHVTVFKARALPGKRAASLKHFEKWNREQRKQAKGCVRSTLVILKDKPDELMGAIHWDNSRNYRTNSRREEQDEWYREWRRMLARAPQWFDGTLAAQVPKRVAARKPAVKRATGRVVAPARRAVARGATTAT